MGQQDVGPSGVVTGRGAFHLSSSILVGDEENTHCWKLYFITSSWFVILLK
ncbi:hypothetical protein [Rummeliibacillus suwonensis]|uniref:hypothetical protein n=1 Tax=Rummeliibacillus suwonensis TaxID=1306154 RepID=UPI001AAF4CC6|nr:hypothetical protein [Rummeliibacillus suwonensis]MBO2536688.1 hypothetical protein [Rummeliibacillus suwonensis]